MCNIYRAKYKERALTKNKQNNNPTEKVVQDINIWNEVKLQSNKDKLNLHCRGCCIRNLSPHLDNNYTGRVCLTILELWSLLKAYNFQEKTWMVNCG